MVQIHAQAKNNRKFRDTNAWYHIVWRVDSTQSTADDRWIYVNGVQESLTIERWHRSK